MGSWDFSQIHVDAGKSNEKIIRQFMECYFSEVAHSENLWAAPGGVIYPVFEGMPGISYRFEHPIGRKTVKQLFFIVNRLVPDTYVYYEFDEGSNSSDAYDRTEIIYDPKKCERFEGSYSFCWGEGTQRRDHKKQEPIEFPKSLSYSDSYILLKMKAEADKKGYTELYKAVSSLPDLNVVTTIGDHEFAWNEDLTSIVIPDGVTSIGKEAFECCHYLTSVVIPDSVTNIGERAFSHCIKLADKNGFVIVRNVLYNY